MATDEKQPQQGAGKVVVKAKYRTAERAQVFLGLVLVLMIVVIGAAGWWWWKIAQKGTSGDTGSVDNEQMAGGEEAENSRLQAAQIYGMAQDWPIYTNEDMRLQFRYPEGWQVMEKQQDEDQPLIFVVPETQEADEEIEVAKAPVVMQVIEGKEFSKAVIDAEELYETESIVERKLAGVEGVYIEGEEATKMSDGSLVQVLMKWGDNLLGVIFVDSRHDDFSEEIFKQLVDTIEPLQTEG